MVRLLTYEERRVQQCDEQILTAQPVEPGREEASEAECKR